MNLFFGRLKSLSLWFLTLFLGIGFIFLVINGYQELQRIKQFAQKRETLILANQKMNMKNEEMYREISRLKYDPIFLEEIARREFGLVKPDEIIFFLDEDHSKEASRNVSGTQPTQRR